MNTKSPIILIALLAIAIVSIAAWKPSEIQGPRAFSAAALACSADGKTVYAADLNRVWKSEDAGITWKDVTPK